MKKFGEYEILDAVIFDSKQLLFPEDYMMKK